MHPALLRFDMPLFVSLDDILLRVSNEPSETSFEEVKPTDLSSLVENMKEGKYMLGTRKMHLFL